LLYTGRDATASSSFERLQERQKIVDLVGIKLKRWHGRMTGFDTLSQGFLQSFDRVPTVQRSAWWCDFERAFSHAIYGVTPSAIIESERLATLLGG
jgi:hypothetical protein